MFNISKKKYESKLECIQKKNQTLKYKQKLDKEKYKYKKKFKLPSTSKLMAVYLFILLNVIITYSMVAMWKFSDLSYLGILITDIAAQVITYVVYMAKSTKENTVGGIVYDMAMRSQDLNNINDDTDNMPDDEIES